MSTSSAETPVTAWFSQRLQLWANRRLPAGDAVTLHRRNIYIVPSRYGLLFVVAAALIFIAAINYAVSLAFGLAFFMVSLFIVTILHSFNNLNGLRLQRQPAAPVFCGEQAMFQILLSRSPYRRHEALEFSFPKGQISYGDLSVLGQDRVTVFTNASRRGRLQAPRLRIASVFPLGLCRVWSMVDLHLSCLVYPTPVPVSLNPLFSRSNGTGETVFTRDGSEDFHGLRSYVTGDSMHQVAWKAVARGQGMQVKQFVEYVDDRVWLDWTLFAGCGTEERLSRLCFCVLKLSATNTAYGLRLPGIEIPPAKGAAHRTRLLEALALYGEPMEAARGH